MIRRFFFILFSSYSDSLKGKIKAGHADRPWAFFQNQSKFSDNRLENLAIKSKANPRIFNLAVYE